MLVVPAKDEKTSSERLAVLLQAAEKLGVTLDPRGFAEAWLADHTRVFLAMTDGQEEATAIAIMAFGRRYYDSDNTASLMVCEGPAREPLLAYIADTCKVLGVQELYFEGRDGDVLPSEPVNFRVHKVT